MPLSMAFYTDADLILNISALKLMNRKILEPIAKKIKIFKDIKLTDQQYSYMSW